MPTLVDKLTDPAVRSKVVEACCKLVESEVESKRGLSGAAIKAGYKVVRALKPGMIPAAVNSLLPEFASEMQPIYAGANEDAAAFAEALKADPSGTADRLLAVTDAKAEKANNRTLKKTYDRLRSTAKDNVAAAVPGLADALQRFV